MATKQEQNKKEEGGRRTPINPDEDLLDDLDDDNEVKTEGKKEDIPKRRRSEGDMSETSEDRNRPGLHQIFRNVTRPIGFLNHPETRDDPELRERSKEYLKRVSYHAVSQAVKADTYELYNKIRSQDELLRRCMDKIDRLELNTKATSRAQIEKRGAVYPNPDHTYPDDYAPEDTYAKAVLSLKAAVGTIEKQTQFSTEPFNYMLELCSESNKIASTYGLTKDQQLKMIMNFVPGTDPVFEIFSDYQKLDDVFEVISAMSTKILTRSELEAQVNAWKLDHSSLTKLNYSLVQLMSLLKKMGGEKASDPEFFQKVITRLKLEKLPNFVVRQLDEAFVSLVHGEKLLDSFQVILGPLKSMVKLPIAGQNGGKAHVHTINTDGEGAEKQQQQAYYPPAPQFVHVPYPMTAQSTTQQGTVPKQKAKKGKQAKAINNCNQVTQQPQVNPKQSVSQNGTPKKRPNKGKPNWVEQWPEGKQYISKNGNQLTREFETWFADFCFRCGHASHKGTDCRIYPDRMTILSLCSICRQGLHDVCRSKRFNKAQLSDKIVGNEMVKAIRELQNTVSTMQNAQMPMYPIFYGQNGMQQQQQIEHQN